MKNILIFCLLLSLFSLPISSKAQESAPADPNPAKTRAMEIYDRLSSVIGGDRNPDSEVWDSIRAEIDNYQKEFGVSEATTKNLIYLRKRELWSAKRFSDVTRYQALLQQLATDPIPEIAELAKQQLATLDRIEKLKTTPIDLKFTALDGTPVDLSKMQGKVVAIYFWGAYDPDCIPVTPKVMDVYNKYHEQGFEAVGISLDENRKTLVNFIRQNGITWPQYFDGLKWSNTISRGYGISSIPTIWLVDKKGMVVAKPNGDDLDSLVENLLKAP